jgi:hypothetical protein
MKVTLLLVSANTFGAGKDTACDLIAKSIKQSTQSKSTKIFCYRFADKLKEWAQQMTGIKRKILPFEHYDDIVVDFTQEQKEQYCTMWQMTLGQLLQKFATEACRDNFDELIWCKCLAQEINDQISDTKQYSPDCDRLVFLIPDFRFNNEEQLIDYVTSSCVVYQQTMRIERPLTEIYHNTRDVNHRSETELSKKTNWTHEVDNSKDISFLEDQCKQIALKICR